MSSTGSTPTGTPVVRAAAPSDLDDLLALNEAWVPHVGPLDVPGATGLLESAERALVVRGPDGDLLGFVVVLGAGADYGSPNYRWFAQRHERFTYVDRIAVSSSARRQGIGQLLYREVARHAAGCGSPVVCAEVNLDPPNPDSLAFHTGMGFEPVGTQWTYGDTVQVQLLEWRP